jgi:bifunctional ADP-heptose synthase (sugar kinase/adenylyltransferase)
MTWIRHAVLADSPSGRPLDRITSGGPRLRLAVRSGGRIVATSGGFDPIHPGHISSLQAAAAKEGLGGILAAVSDLRECVRGEGEWRPPRLPVSIGA